MRARWTGLLPIAFFIWTAAVYARGGNTPELLWICNISNLLLGVGILADRALLTWGATLWILQGIGPWLLDARSVSGFELHSFFTHLGSAAVGLHAVLSRPLPERARNWGAATVFFVAVQLLTRLTTPARFNVNQVFEIHPSMRGLFSSYPAYYAANFAFFVTCLAATELVLRRLHPLLQRRENREALRT